MSYFMDPFLIYFETKMKAFTDNRRLFIRICNYFYPRISPIFASWWNRRQFLLFLLAESFWPIKSKHTLGFPMFCAICWRFAYFSYRLAYSTFRNFSRQYLSIIFNIYFSKYWSNGRQFHWKIRRRSTVILPSMGAKPSDILSANGKSYTTRGGSWFKFTKERPISCFIFSLNKKIKASLWKILFKKSLSNKERTRRGSGPPGPGPPGPGEDQEILHSKTWQRWSRTLPLKI